MTKYKASEWTDPMVFKVGKCKAFEGMVLKEGEF